MSDSATFNGQDLTGGPRFAAGGHWIGRACGIGPTAHKVSDTSGGSVIRGIWYCRKCKEGARQRRKAPTP